MARPIRFPWIFLFFLAASSSVILQAPLIFSAETRPTAGSLRTSSKEVFVQASIGNFHTCGLTSTGSVYCWGRETGGLLGYRPPIPPQAGGYTVNLSPLKVEGLSSVIQISAGSRHTCALEITGKIKCWGENRMGQLGNGTRIRSLTPAEVVRLDHVVQISAGITNTCALKDDGHVFCWGETFAGFGKGESEESSTPVEVPEVATAKTISTFENTCWFGDPLLLNCWGSNLSGQLGNSQTTPPIQKSTLNGFKFDAVSVGGSHVCAKTSLGELYCWGLNLWGQLGQGDHASNHHGPQKVALEERVQSVASTMNSTCATLISGHVVCWGKNEHQEVAAASQPQVDFPTEVKNLSDLVSVVVAPTHGCALSRLGAIYCWGDNVYGDIRFYTSLP